VSSPAGRGHPISFPDDHPDAARLRLAEALRPLITMTVSGTPDDGSILATAEAVERLGADLAAGAGTDRRIRRPPDTDRPTIEYFPTSPIAGILNPIAPPVRLEVVDGEDGTPAEIRATAWFDYPYEGPPSCVHGGVIAATFDEILGAANMVSGNPGMTGTLTVRYRKPTPLRTDLRLEARFLERDGRKIRTWAGMYHGDVLTAEADGLFIEVMPRQMLAIAEQNATGPDDGLLAAMRRGVDAMEAGTQPGTEPGTEPGRSTGSA
jgi:acyl-coenzyme A thioesterase PaaI-like protein